MNLIDSHCHLFFDSLVNDIPGVLKHAADNGVNRMITVGTDLDTSKQCIKIANNYDNVFASVGIHPHDAGATPEDFIARLKDLANEQKVIAIGEMGLDYFRNHSSRDEQIPVFAKQLELAREIDLPYIFHNREADDDVISTIKDSGYFNGVAHCFSSGLESARKFLDMGLFISFSGNLTYNKSDLPEVAEYIPLDRLLVETDSPFLSPVPHRGKPNNPGRTIHVAEKIAEIKKINFEEVAQQLTANTEKLFRLQNQEAGH